MPIAEAVRWHKRVVMAMGSQMAKTTLELNIIGHKLDDDPAPVLYIGPTKSNVDGVIEPQMTAMLRSAAGLWAKTEKGRKAQKLVKRVAGVTLRLAWAGSPTELASQPAHTVLVDEVDRMDAIPGEGDPVSLAEARIATYPDGRLIVGSTPTEGTVDVERHPDTGIDHWKVADSKDVASPIWKLFQEGTRHEWAVPCPHCTEYFVPRFRLLWWPEKATARVARQEAKLTCARCGALIDDAAKAQMNERGVYLAPGQSVNDGQVVGDPPASDTASFWVSGLMSPWQSFGDLAAKFVRAVRAGDQDRIRAAINTGFGELYAFKGDALPAESVRACCGAYKTGEIPDGVKGITCGVDVQKNRLVYVVRGWGYSAESWLLDSGEIWGDTDQRQVWAELAAMRDRKYGSLSIKRLGVDSGYRPGDTFRRPDNIIYDFCFQHRGWALPTKGRERLAKPLQPSLIDVTFRGQTQKNGLQLWHIDTDYFKSWVQGRLVWPVDQAGRFWVPADVTDDYCAQMTSETRVAKPSGQASWVRIRKENHFFDCEALNVAMAQSLGYHRRLRPAVKPASEAVAVPAAVPPPPARAVHRAPMMRKNWTTSW